MSNKIYDLASYAFEKDELILIDANIWMYLYPPPSNPKDNKHKKYSKAFSELIKAQAKPVLCSMILSEYLNRYSRIEWNALKKQSIDKKQYEYNNFKAFRQSKYFLKISDDACCFAKDMLNYCCVCSLAENQFELSSALNEFLEGEVDFNDAMLIAICKQHHCKLMTDDADFKKSDISILTFNRNLLSARS